MTDNPALADPERLAAAEAAADRVPGSRLTARLYDPVLWLGERTGLARWRRRLLSAAAGTTLEIGAGTGLNLSRYPDGLEQLVLTEPDRDKAARLRQRVASGKGPAAPVEVLRAPAELLPFRDRQFDTVVSTLALCTVADPRAAIAEMARVLRPGGSLLFLEHIRADGRTGRLQDRLERPWFRLADGCHCNRRTLEHLGEAGFEVEVAARADRFYMPPVARPIVSGTARIAAAGAGSEAAGPASADA